MLFLKAIVFGTGFILGAEIVLVSYQIIKGVIREMKK